MEPGADQLCGRVVVGLPFTELDFDVLPPHFDLETNAMLTSTLWESILPGYERFPKGFKSALPFLLASLLYHYDFLKLTLNPGHPVLLSKVFTQNPLLEQLKRGVLLGYGDCPVTGINSYITQADVS